jgi:hypothetical protein
MLFVSGCYNEAIPQRDLANRYKTTTGQVRHRDCANHGAVYYRFEVDSRPQAGQAPQGLLSCEGVSVGTPVTVYYDPVNPAVHTLKEPRLWYEEERGLHIPVWLLVPLLFIGLILLSIVGVKLHGATIHAKKNTENKEPGESGGA